MVFELAIGGDTAIDGELALCDDQAFRKVVSLFRGADIGYVHIDAPLTDFTGPEVYGAAEPGGDHAQSPPSVAEELKWAGINVVSHAGNHALDYSYGGLRNTWEALDSAGVPHAGTGEDLFEARSPTYVDTEEGRVALVSMSSTFPRWSQAGYGGRELPGRPGVNPLRFEFVVDPDQMATIKEFAQITGQWITEQKDGMWFMNPSGLHTSRIRFIESERPNVTTQVYDVDRHLTLDSIREASNTADFVLVHIHNHEWKIGENLSIPPDFITSFARECIGSGADVVVSNGNHAEFRGIELFNNQPIFYGPGQLFRMNTPRPRYPHDMYLEQSHNLSKHSWDATPSEGREAFYDDVQYPEYPAGGYRIAPIDGAVVPLCRFDSSYELESVSLYPCDRFDEPISRKGVPKVASGELASKMIEHIAELSKRYGTAITYGDQTGEIKLSS